MEKRANHVLVGGFVLAALAAFVGFVLWIGKAEFDREFAYYKIFFEGTVTGLKEGNPVRYRGVPVGSVTSIRINPENVEQVEVVIQVPSGTPIKQGAEASLEIQGITGATYVLITGGTQAAPVLKTGRGTDMAVIPSKPSQLEKIIQSAPELASRFIVLVDRANQMLDERNQTALAETLENIRKLSAALGGKSGDVERLIVDSAATATELRHAAASFGQLAKEMQGVSGEIRQSTKALPATLEEVRKTVAALGALSVQLEGTIAENRGPLRDFSSSGFYDVTQTLSDLRLLIGNLNRLTSRVESDPARFLFGDINQTGVEPK